MNFLRIRHIFLAASFGCLLFIFWNNLIQPRYAFTQHKKNSMATTPTILSTKEKNLTKLVQIRSVNRSSKTVFLQPPADVQDRNNADAFEPYVEEDFQTIECKIPMIPHIIHFIFITGIKGNKGVPGIYKDNIVSFYNFNSYWTFYFWSDASARDLIASRQPELLPTYDNYHAVIMKADALRYVLLYEFGGVYVDLDIKCLRPLDRATMKYSCILTPEPFEHSALLYKMPYVFSNAITLCRPKHPFYKQLIDELPKSAHFNEVMKSTGPLFLTLQFDKYIQKQSYVSLNSKPSQWSSNTPYFYSKMPANERKDALYVSNTQYFMNSIDKSQLSTFYRICSNKNAENSIIYRGCKLLRRRQSEGTLNPFSFTDHNWRHLYSIKASTQMISIQTIIPTIKEYDVH